MSSTISLRKMHLLFQDLGLDLNTALTSNMHIKTLQQKEIKRKRSRKKGNKFQ